MSLSCLLEPLMLKHLKSQVYSAISHEKRRKYSDDCFLDLRINKAFPVNQELLIFKANPLSRTSP